MKLRPLLAILAGAFALCGVALAADPPSSVAPAVVVENPYAHAYAYTIQNIKRQYLPPNEGPAEVWEHVAKPPLGPITDSASLQKNLGEAIRLLDDPGANVRLYDERNSDKWLAAKRAGFVGFG